MDKEDVEMIALCLAVVITCFVIPFLIYLYIGFFSWMLHDPLNVIEWPRWGTETTIQQSDQSSHD